MKSELIAAIDIGSNAIRLVICEVDGERGTDKKFKRVAFLRVPIRLGEDVFTVGGITPEKRDRLRNAMVGFSYTMKSFGVSDYRACATSAMREAINGADVVQEIYRVTGVSIDIISGQLEADTIFAAGGLERVMDAGGAYLYVDVGGGSTEVVVYCDGQKIDSRSFRLGTVRMLSGATKDSEMESFKKWLKSISTQYCPHTIIGSGGNINKVQRMLAKKEGETIPYTEIRNLYRTLKAMSYEQRIEELGLKTYRADVIIPALKIFTTVAKTCEIDKIAVPRVGLADGIIRELSRKRM